ncbi:hypothetical protein BsWGS_20437 [Bradybaena similaris]
MAAPRVKKPKNRKTKTFLVFDEKARAEYLRGFHKRKIERKKLAREELDRKILAERKELLKQVRDSKNSHLRQQAVVEPEIESLVDPEIYDLPQHTVTVANIGDVDFVGKSGLRLGQNTGRNKQKQDDDDGDERGEYTAKPVKNKSLRHQLAACTSQLSSQKLKAKKVKKKNMLKKKFRAQKKGQKKGKK